MENLYLVTAASILVGIPVIVAEHYAVKALWPCNHSLWRYALGTLAIALVLATAWVMTGRAELIAELVVVIAVTGGTTMGCYWIDGRLEGEREKRAADDAEMEARRGKAQD